MISVLSHRNKHQQWMKVNAQPFQLIQQLMSVIKHKQLEVQNC